LSYLVSVTQETYRARVYKSQKGEGFNSFGEPDLINVVEAIQTVIDTIPEPAGLGGPSEDAPIPFDVESLADHLDLIAGSNMTPQVVQFISTLTMRIRMMLADRRLGPLVVPEKQPSFAEWLENYIGGDQAKNGTIAILDLSLVPSDVLHVAIAVIARIVFEATQRYKKLNGDELPTVLVLEEAHNFIQKYSTEDGSAGGQKIWARSDAFFTAAI
jgi:uncharacterized protein